MYVRFIIIVYFKKQVIYFLIHVSICFDIINRINSLSFLTDFIFIKAMVFRNLLLYFFFPSQKLDFKHRNATSLFIVKLQYFLLIRILSQNVKTLNFGMVHLVDLLYRTVETWRSFCYQNRETGCPPRLQRNSVIQ